MIGAAAKYAEGKGTPPPELASYFQWRTWDVLPESGGSRDQKAGELDRMLASANAYEVMKLHRSGKLKSMTKEQIAMLKFIKANYG